MNSVNPSSSFEDLGEGAENYHPVSLVMEITLSDAG